MKKRIFLFTIAALLIAGQVFAATPGYRQNPGTGDILGQGKYQQDAHKIFRMVRYVPVTYSGAATLAADSIVIWNLTSDDGVTVTTTTTSSDSAVAGILVTQALTPDTDGNTAAQDVGQGNWTWLQTYGLAQADVVGSVITTTAGDAMGTSTTAGEVVQHVGSIDNPREQGVAGFFFDASAADAANVEVFIRLD